MNEPSEMPTPRTDKIADECWSEREWSLAYSRMADFARQLERDLSTLRIAAEAARVAFSELILKIGTVEVFADQTVGTAATALASLRSELAKTTPTTPETPASHPG